MTTKTIFKAVEDCNDEILNGLNGLDIRLKSAKNYVANRNFNKWAFSKLIATEKFGVNYGAQSKPFFYKYHFYDILGIKNQDFRSEVINKFLKWSDKVGYLDIRKKFDIDQKTTKRFELLVHKDRIPFEIKFEIKQAKYISSSNQQFFDDGLRKEISREIALRNRKVIELAKEKYRTKCTVCQFDFGVTYGTHGAGYIEMHHLHPISFGKRKTTVDDLRPVCANCHRMLHKGDRLLTIKELKGIIKLNRKSK